MKMQCNMPDHAAAVECMLEGFVQCCQLMIAAGLAPPDPTDVPSVQYRLEPAGEEDWKLPQNVIRDGWGDCEDLAGWRAAGLRATGEDPEARVVVVKTGGQKLHAVVLRGDGEMDDVCRELRFRDMRGRGISVLGGGGTTVHKRGDNWTPDQSGQGAPPAAGGNPGASSGPSYPSRYGGHVRISPGNSIYDTITARRQQEGADHPFTQAYQDAAQARADAGETAANRYGGGSVQKTYSSPEEADAAGIDPNSGQRYYTPPFDPNDPSTWPDGYAGYGDPADPSTWGMYGGYGGYPGGQYGGGWNPYYGYGGAYGYPQDSYSDMPYAGGYPWETPPDDLSPGTSWNEMDWGGINDGGYWS